PLVRAVAEVCRDQDVLRQNRERARLKQLFLRHGWTAESMLDAIAQRLPFALDRAVPEVPPHDVYRDHVGVHRQKQDGLVYVGAAALRGRISSAHPRAAANAAECCGAAEVGTASMQSPLI